MPVPGVPNNPGGANGWDDFAPEQPYGEVTNQARLAGGAPLAGQAIAAGPIAAPKRAQRAATKGTTAQPQTVEQPAPTGPPQAPQPSAPDPAWLWSQLAAQEGASPLVHEYAARAASA